MRAFKKVWAEFDPDRIGFIPRKSIVPFFSVRLVDNKVYSMLIIWYNRN
jgi:hypothetical protein